MIEPEEKILMLREIVDAFDARPEASSALPPSEPQGNCELSRLATGGHFAEHRDKDSLNVEMMCRTAKIQPDLPMNAPTDLDLMEIALCHENEAMRLKDIADTDFFTDSMRRHCARKAAIEKLCSEVLLQYAASMSAT